MKWIKYKVLQSVVEGENVFIDKKIGHNEANLVIAQAEAYQGKYEIVEDSQSFEKEPLGIEFGGTGAKTLSEFMEVLGINSRKAVVAPTTNLDELITAGIWYEYNKVCTSVPPEIEGIKIVALVESEAFSNITIQTLTTFSNGVISAWKRRYTSTGGWGNWYKCINSNDMSKLKTMHLGISTLGVTTDSTTTLAEVINLLDDVSEVTFYTTSSRYPGIYAEVLAGIQTAYPNITSIGAHVTIRKNGTTSYITVEDYNEPSNKFETIYKGDVADNWVKYVTTNDTESRRMYINPSNFGCSNSDGTLDLVSMINKMDAKSHVNFWINNSGQFTKIYNEILTGIKTKYPEVTNIFGNVDILKTDGTAYVKASQYDNPNNVFIATYSTVNSVGMSEWVKVASGTDLSKKVGIAVQYTTITPTGSINDVLDIDKSDPYSEKNQPKKVYQMSTDTTAISNMPPAYPKGTAFVGMRFVHYFSSTNILVELVAFPSGRRWYNNYVTNAWKGWTCEPANANGDTISGLKEEINDLQETLATKIDSSLELLWTNEDPTASGTQYEGFIVNISSDLLNSFAGLKVKYRCYNTSGTYVVYDVIGKSTTRHQYYDADGKASGVTNYFRNINFNILGPTTNIVFGPINNITSGITYEFMLIPYEIYGVK